MSNTHGKHPKCVVSKRRRMVFMNDIHDHPDDHDEHDKHEVRDWSVRAVKPLVTPMRFVTLMVRVTPQSGLAGLN